MQIKYTMSCISSHSARQLLSLMPLTSQSRLLLQIGDEKFSSMRYLVPFTTFTFSATIRNFDILRLFFLRFVAHLGLRHSLSFMLSDHAISFQTLFSLKLYVFVLLSSVFFVLFFQGVQFFVVVFFQEYFFRRYKIILFFRCVVCFFCIFLRRCLVFLCFEEMCKFF